MGLLKFATFNLIGLSLTSITQVPTDPGIEADDLWGPLKLTKSGKTKGHFTGRRALGK